VKARYVVDTNVLIAASAADPVQPKDIDATPSDPELRRQVWEWLEQFRSSDAKMVLDTENKIYEEYTNKLGFNDFGIQVVMHKWSTAAVDDVSVQYDADGHGVLPVSLAPVIHDLADRKMVAAALDAKRIFGLAPIAFAGDTDWHEWEVQLLQHGVELEPIIEQWSRAKFAKKKLR
jgi:hypothetical protein